MCSCISKFPVKKRKDQSESIIRLGLALLSPRPLHGSLCSNLRVIDECLSFLELVIHYLSWNDTANTHPLVYYWLLIHHQYHCHHHRQHHHLHHHHHHYFWFISNVVHLHNFFLLKYYLWALWHRPIIIPAIWEAGRRIWSLRLAWATQQDPIIKIKSYRGLGIELIGRAVA